MLAYVLLCSLNVITPQRAWAEWSILSLDLRLNRSKKHSLWAIYGRNKCKHKIRTFLSVTSSLFTFAICINASTFRFFICQRFSCLDVIILGKHSFETWFSGRHKMLKLTCGYTTLPREPLYRRSLAYFRDVTPLLV